MTTETVWAYTPAALDDAIQDAVRAHHNIMPAQIHLASHRSRAGNLDEPYDVDLLTVLLVWERD